MVEIEQFEVRLVHEKTVQYPLKKLIEFNDAATVMRTLAGDKPHEEIHVIIVNGQNHISGTCMVSRGGLHGAGVTAADLLRPVLLSGANAFIMGHNHPSGDITPSKEDIYMTRKVLDSCKVLGMTLLDHIIVTNSSKSSSLHDYMKWN